MRAKVLCFALVFAWIGCGVSGFRVAKKDGAPVLPAAASAELVDAPPAGAQELGRVEVIGADGDACKTEARERARTLLGASLVVVAPHPEPFTWQNTETSTLAAPRCVGTGYAGAAGAAPGAAPAPAPAPDPAAAPAPAPAPAQPAG
jgi:hypothetical protein